MRRAPAVPLLASAAQVESEALSASLGDPAEEETEGEEEADGEEEKEEDDDDEEEEESLRVKPAAKEGIAAGLTLRSRGSHFRRSVVGDATSAAADSADPSECSRRHSTRRRRRCCGPPPGHMLTPWGKTLAAALLADGRADAAGGECDGGVGGHGEGGGDCLADQEWEGAKVEGGCGGRRGFGKKLNFTADNEDDESVSEVSLW